VQRASWSDVFPTTRWRRVIELSGDSDGAELKLTVLDTPELTLSDHGVVVRARRVQKKGDDSVVRLRPVVASQLPARLRRTPGFAAHLQTTTDRRFAE
jgi:hypothetical protein